MRRRLLVTLGVLFLLFLVPGLPPVRNALLRWGTSVAERAGYAVSYSESSGNLFYGVGLENLKVKGPGIDVSADTLRLGYTLPALLTGTLPLRTELSGVRGTLDADKLTSAVPATPTTPPPGAQPRRWFRPVLKRAELADVALDVSGLPFDVPDVKLTRLEARQTGEAFAFDTALSAGDAALEASGTVLPDPFKLNVTLQRADVALAQDFFDGLQGGALSGTLQADTGGVTADLELDGGKVDLVGLELSQVAGPVTVRNQKITTKLTGRALGGPLNGKATVDLAAQRWQADVTGNAALTDALVWVSQGRLSKNVIDTALEPSGSADVRLRVGGWRSFTLSGQATGKGTLLGEPLRDLSVDFGFKSAVGTDVEATATLGGEPFRFALTPQDKGFAITANGQNLPLRGFSGDLNVDLLSQQGSLTGTTDLSLDGSALGRSATLKADARTDGQGWQVDLSGKDERGAQLSGALELKDNILGGTARATKLTLPGLTDPVTVSAQTDGPLSDLPLTLRVAGQQGVRPRVNGVHADADFSGQIAATLKNSSLTGINGEFGPLEVAGSLSDLRYKLLPTALSGRATGRVALQNGRLSRQKGQLTATARLTTQNVRGGGVTLPDLGANVELSQGEELTASLTDEKAGVNVKVQNGELKGTLDGTRIGALGETFAARGSVSGQTAQLGKSLNLDLRAKTTGDGPKTTLTAKGNAQNTKLSLKSDKGATLAGRTLDGAALSGNASLTGRSADLSGTLGGVGVSVAAKPDASGQVGTQAKLTGGGQAFSARFDSLESWETDGTLPLGELGRALGLPLKGTLQTTLARQGKTFSGLGAAQGTAFGLPFRAQATSQGDKLTLEASSAALSSVFGQLLTLSGTALPETDAALQLGTLGVVQVQGKYPNLTLDGSGRTLAVSRAGLELPPQPWRLNGNLAQGQAELRLGKSKMTAQRGKNGWTLDAQLEQAATLRGEPLELSANLTQSPQNPDGRVRGTLALGGAPLEFSGTLRDLAVNGTVPAKTLQPGLLGTLNLEGRVNALAQTYEARSSWRQNGTEALSVEASGKRAELTATVAGDGLEAQLDTTSESPKWTVQATDFALEQLPVAALQNSGAQLNGTLSKGSKGYSGRLRLAAGDAAVQLSGQNERLELNADFQRGTLGAKATGTLEPELNVQVQAQARDAATVQGTIQGTLTQPRLSGRVRTAAQNLGGGQFSLPAQQVDVSASLQNGFSASLTGDTVDAQLQNGTWRGTVSLPFTLRNAPHQLTGTLQGKLADPEVDGQTVQGPLTLSRSGLGGSLTLSPGLDALPDAKAQVDVTATPDLRWRVGLKGNATLPYRNLPATLTGRVGGQGTRYDGTAALNVAGQEVPLTVSGEAGQVQASAEFESLELSAFAPVEGTLSGNARLTTGDEVRYFADIQAEGQAAGRPFDLTVSANRSALELNGTVAGASVTAQGKTPLKTLNISVADSRAPLELNATLGLGDTLTLRGAGGWRGEALKLSGAYTPNRGSGKLQVALADAVLTGSVVQAQPGRTLATTLDAPTGLLGLDSPVKASLRVVQNQSIEIEAFSARLGENTLALSGTVPNEAEPQAALTGTLTVPAAGAPVALRLTALETGYLASLTQGDLVLRSVLNPKFRPERVRLVGTLARPRLELESNLVWQVGAGFSGRADATLGLRGASATLTLLGQEQLRLRGSASYRDVTVATLAAQLSADPWRDRDVTGTLNVSAPAAQLSPVWPGDPLTLTGPLTLSGTLSAPELQGPLELRGALTATGTMQATRQGAKLSLAGSGLRGVATVDTEGYRTTLTLTNLGLSGLLPQLALRHPTLSGALRATQSWGSTPEAQLSDLRLTSGQSRVAGRLRFAAGVSGSLELDVRLGDFVPGWQGRVAGRAFAGPGAPLSGALTLTGLGPKAADWRLGGEVALAGSVTDPTVELALRGQGGADGTLQATATPLQGRLELTSTLSLLGAQTDLTLTRTKESVSAAGTLRYRGFRAALDTQGGRVQLRGQDKLAGWRGVYGPAQFSLSGPLESLNPQLKGDLALSGAAGLGTFNGTLSRAAFGPVTLGDVALTRNAAGLELRGDTLDAQVGLSGTLPWTLEKLELSGPGSTVLTLSGQGTRTQGRVTGQLSAATVTLPLTAQYTSEGLNLTAQGTLPVGELGVQARYQDRWRGQVTITDPEGQRVLTGALTGTLSAPTLTGDLELTRSAGAVRGTFEVGRETLKLDARVTSPQLSAPLSVTGGGWPLNLQVAAPSEDAPPNVPPNVLSLAFGTGRLEPSGALVLGVGPARLELRAGGDGGRALVLQLSAPAAPGLVLRTTLPAAPSDYAALLSGVTFQGAGQTRGSLTLGARPQPQLKAQALSWRTAAGRLVLSGTATLNTTGKGNLDNLAADLTGRWEGGAAAPVAWLRQAVPFGVQVADGQFSATSPKGQLRAQYDAAANRFMLQSELQLGQGQLSADVRYARATGPTGTLTTRSLPVFSVGRDVGTLSSQLSLGETGVSGNGTLELAGGQLDVSGSAGWLRLLPKAAQFAPAGTEALSAQLRLNRFDLGGLPQVTARLPYLSAPVSGVATVTNTQIVGQLVAPELKVLSNTLPTRIDFNGTLAALEARATVADSRLNVRYSRNETGPNAGPNIAGLITLEGFPLQALPEAVVGASQVEADVTGAVRFDLPLRRPAAGYVRVATERLTLQSTDPGSTGEATRGDVALRFEKGSLYVERAEFRGEGFWQAKGVLTPENLDFTLEAQNANFTPLLRLVPPLAALNVGAQGSLELQAAGSASAPDVTLQSSELELDAAGTRYRATHTAASLSGGAFGLKGELLGVSPVTGRLELTGSGQVNLAPFATSGLALRFKGVATIPTLGEVSAVQGRIYPSNTGWRLDSSGTLGRPFRVFGSLAPLGLKITGQALNVQARRLFVASSSTDVDLGLSAKNGVFTLSGGAFVRQAQLSLNRGGTPSPTAAQAEPQSSSPAPGTSMPSTVGAAVTDPGSADTTLGATTLGTASSIDADSTVPPNPSDLGASSLGGAGLSSAGLSSTGLSSTGLSSTGLSSTALDAPDPGSSSSGTETASDLTDLSASISSAVRRKANPVLARIRFGNVRLEAPREVFFNEAFGNAELGLDLTLSGTAAKPLLDGQAETLSGSIRFSGQDFSLTKAVATFDPARGVYPTLALAATASFDRSRAVGDAQSSQLQIVEPTTPTFEVQLQIDGGFEESVTGRRVLDLSPTLSSNAQLQEPNSSSARPLTEAELVSLLTLGRLQLDAAIGGSNSLAGTVAESALDTAVDLLVVSELQDALNDVIGADLLEIRTSAFSSILGAEGGQKNFGVSVKLGGYLSDNLFASVQVGRFDDPEQAYALSNEFLLRYTAAPLELNLSGGVNFLDGQSLAVAVTDFSLGLSYAITPLISLDASLDTTAGGRDTSVGFGVSFTW